MWGNTTRNLGKSTSSSSSSTQRTRPGRGSGLTVSTVGCETGNRVNFVNSDVSASNMDSSIAAFYNHNNSSMGSTSSSGIRTSNNNNINGNYNDDRSTGNNNHRGANTPTQNNRSRLSVIASPSSGASGTSPKRLTGTSSYSYFSVDDQKRLKHSLSESESREHSLAKELNEAKLTIKILNDALEFRCEEIGLSGHKDLLSKLSRNRGEIETLQNEIIKLKEGIVKSNEAKFDIKLNEDKLKSQISSLEDRITIYEKDNIRFQSKSHESVVAELRTAESERDVLLEYIQGEANKYSALSSKCFEFEANMRVFEQNYSSASDKVVLLESSLSKEVDRNNNLQVELNSANIKLKELSQTHTIIKQERERTSNDLEKKRIEVEELTQLQLSALIELREKDDHIVKLSEELKGLTFQCKNLQLSLPAAQTENSSLKSKNRELEDSLNTLNIKLESYASKAQALEPEVARLRSEKLQWVHERGCNQADLDRINPIEKSFNELHTDLHNVSETVAISNAVLSGIYEENKKFLEESSDNLLSQKHAIWIALPSLRQFCPVLYDKIRSIAQDLHKKEMQYHDIRLAHQSSLREIELMRKEFREEVSQLQQTNEVSKGIVSNNAAHMKEMEAELVRLRTLRTTIDQVKLVLQSHPGGLAQILKGEYIDDHLSPSKIGITESSFGGDSLNNLINTSIMCRNNNGELTRKLESLLNKFEIGDSILPDVVGRVILSNSKSVVSLQASLKEIDRLKLVGDDLRVELADLRASHTAALQTIEDCGMAFKSSEALHDSTKAELESAIDLSEKQNALVITLEAKLEDAKREKQLKTAMVTSLQQKEESICDRIRQIIEENKNLVAFSNCNSACPTSSAKMIEYLQFFSDLFPSLHNRITLLQLRSDAESKDFSATGGDDSKTPSISAHSSMNISEFESRVGNKASDSDDSNTSTSKFSHLDFKRGGGSISSQSHQSKPRRSSFLDVRDGKALNGSASFSQVGLGRSELAADYQRSIISSSTTSSGMSDRFRIAQQELALMRESSNA